MAKPRGSSWEGVVNFKGQRYRRSFSAEHDAEVWELESKTKLLKGEPIDMGENAIKRKGNLPHTLAELVQHVYDTHWATQSAGDKALINAKSIIGIIGASLPVAKLTKDQVAKIFTGQVKDWSEIGGAPGKISIYTRNTSSGTYKDWQGLAMGGRDYPSTSQKMAGNEQIAQEVAKNRNGIGYVGLAYAKSNGIKAVTIDGVEPVANNAKKYAYARLCYFYAPDKPTAEAQAFMDFVESDAGQAIVRRVGFIPTKDL